MVGRNIRYLTLAIVGAFFLIATIFSFISFIEQRKHLVEIKRQGTWLAHQVEKDLGSFQFKLKIYAFSQQEKDFEKINFLFQNLLRSYHQISFDEKGVDFRTAPGAKEFMKEFEYALHETEIYLLSEELSPTELSEYILAVFRPIESKLSDIVREVMVEHDGKSLEKLISLENRVYWCLAGVCVSALWFGLLLWVERRKAQELQEETKSVSQRLLLALDAMTEGFAVYDEQGALTLCNRRFRKLMQLEETHRVSVDDEEEKIPLTFQEVLREGIRKGIFLMPIRDIDSFIFRQEELLQQEYSVHELELVSGSCYRVEGYQTENRQKVFIYVDITESRRREDELREALIDAESANRAKASFLANISHELRTPLNAIIGFSEIMEGELMGPLGSPHYLEYSRDIVHSGKHLLKLINDILDLSKVQAGHLELDEEDVNPMELINDCLPIVRIKIAEKEQKLDIKVPQKMYFMRVDHRRFKQILINLVTNAMKFTPVGGQITIRLYYPEEGGAHFIVSDTGIGISSKDLKRVMQPFSQVDNRLARGYEGTGLGLPLSCKLVEAHNGILKVVTEVDKGTDIHITIPEWRILRQKPVSPFAYYKDQTKDGDTDQGVIVQKA